MKMKMSLLKNPYVLAVFLQFVFAGVIVLSKAAYNQGINIYIFVFYRQALGALFMIPPAIYFDWKSCPQLKLPTFCKIFGAALIGMTIASTMMAVGLKFTSSTFAAATSNCLPVITIFIALLLRMEKINVKKRVGMAKVVGILFCVGSVAILAFYKGPHFNPPQSLHFIEISNPNVSASGTWLEGALFLVIAILSWSLGLIFLGMLMPIFSSKLMLSALICLSSTIQSLIVAVIMERNPSEWKLTWSVKLLAIIYCGAIGSGLACYLQALVIEMKGAVFLALYSPLSLLIAMAFGFVFLGEPLNLAGIIGGVLSICSLYSVLWAKKIEEEKNKVVVVNAEASECPQMLHPGTTPHQQLSEQYQIIIIKEENQIPSNLQLLNHAYRDQCNN